MLSALKIVAKILLFSDLQYLAVKNMEKCLDSRFSGGFLPVVSCGKKGVSGSR